MRILFSIFLLAIAEFASGQAFNDQVVDYLHLEVLPADSVVSGLVERSEELGDVSFLYVDRKDQKNWLVSRTAEDGELEWIVLPSLFIDGSHSISGANSSAWGSNYLFLFIHDISGHSSWKGGLSESSVQLMIIDKARAMMLICTHIELELEMWWNEVVYENENGEELAEPEIISSGSSYSHTVQQVLVCEDYLFLQTIPQEDGEEPELIDELFILDENSGLLLNQPAAKSGGSICFSWELVSPE